MKQTLGNKMRKEVVSYRGKNRAMDLVSLDVVVHPPSALSQEHVARYKEQENKIVSPCHVTPTSSRKEKSLLQYTSRTSQIVTNYLCSRSAALRCIAALLWTGPAHRVGLRFTSPMWGLTCLRLEGGDESKGSHSKGGKADGNGLGAGVVAGARRGRAGR
jgi:hypothetical protein